MPVYEYECESCGVRFEHLQRMVDAPLKNCPECGGHIHRVMQPVGVIFKGSGFYVTDNRGKSSTGIPARKKEEEAKPSGANAEAAGGGTGSPTENKPAHPKKEAKPAD